MRAIRAAVLAVALTTIAVAFASSSQNWTGEDWRNWIWFRPIDAEPAQETRLVRLSFPFASFGRVQSSFGDLRIIDERGYGTAFILRWNEGKTSQEWRPSRIAEIGYVPGKFTQVEIDTGADDDLHNSVEVKTAERDYYSLVEVAVSDDRKEWRITREKAPLYRFGSDGLNGNQTVSYPDTRSRWLRLRISGHPAQFPLTECRTSFTVSTVAELEDVGADPVRAPEEVGGESRWTVEFAEAVPLSGVRFSTPVAEFDRPVVVECGHEKDQLKTVGENEIYRYRSDTDAESARSHLSFQFPTATARLWRFRVLNRADRPLADLDLHPLYIPRWVFFRQEPGHTYRLLYGNARAKSSTYDLALVTSRKDLENAVTVSVGAERRNPDYVSPEPWTERNPFLLWAALALSVGVLAWLALRSLKTGGTS